MNSPQITYDPATNAVYLRFSDNEIAETLELSESVYIDVDSDGVPVGLEVLNATAELRSGIPPLPDAAALKDLMHRSAA